MIAQLASLALFQQSPSSSGVLSMLPMMIAFAAMVFFLFIMPSKRQKKWQEMLGGLKSGDRVTTTGGIIGIIVSIRQPEGTDAGSLVLRVAPDNVKIEVARNAIASVTIDDGVKKS